MSRAVQQVIAVVKKEFRSELRNRVGINSMGMFVATILLVVLFSVGQQRLTPAISAGLIWISFYFMAVSGLGRSFLSEQERGTILLLRSVVPATPVYFGKLAYNAALSFATNTIFVLLLSTVVPESWSGPLSALLLSTFVLSLGFAASITIVSALLSRASERGLLTAVLSLPILLPLIFLGVDMLSEGAAGRGVIELGPELLLASGYIVVLISISFILFDFVWKE